MRPSWGLSIALIAICALWGADTARASPLPAKWLSQHGSDHPLAGQTFTGSGKRVRIESVLQQARLTRYVLLGEVHDNPDHHLIQAGIIDALADDRHRPSVVFEMVPRRLAKEIGRYDLATDPQLDDFAVRLEWESRGWYSWNIYRPVAQAAAKKHLTMVPGNLNRTVTRSISRDGLATLTDLERRNLALTAALPGAARDALIRDLRDSHCDLMPDTAFPSMVDVQRAKEGSMADAMIRTGYKFGAILIAGNGHVRKDRGVPFALRHLLPGTRIVSLGNLGKSADGKPQEVKVRIPNAHNLVIGLIETQPDKLTANQYELTAVSGEPLYDYIIFTPKFDTTDHCIAMREQFKDQKKIKP
jgi:uncharacterized iron-regulated protein